MTPLPEITIRGFLTEEKLAAALKGLFADQWLGTQIVIAGTKQRWDMACRLGGVTAVIDYDGDEHYRHSIKIKGDNAKDAAARAAGYCVIRFP
jgi:very-short-patch-repair endonuclease